jgi:uncharacterized protein
MTLKEILLAPWPWYVSGPLIGLTVPILLIIGNKSFGISSSLRHICAACFPARIPFFKYEWKKEVWNLFFVSGIFLGALIAVQFLSSLKPIELNAALKTELASYGITNYSHFYPEEIFNWSVFSTIKGWLILVFGGLLIGFGTRYAGGCTSGHAIMGLSTLQWPSLVATISFMAGGYIMANYLVPFILTL